MDKAVGLVVGADDAVVRRRLVALARRLPLAPQQLDNAENLFRVLQEQTGPVATLTVATAGAYTALGAQTGLATVKVAGAGDDALTVDVTLSVISVAVNAAGAGYGSVPGITVAGTSLTQTATAVLTNVAATFTVSTAGAYTGIAGAVTGVAQKATSGLISKDSSYLWQPCGPIFRPKRKRGVRYN